MAELTELVERIAHSDIKIEPAEGDSLDCLLFSLVAGCVVVGPEKGHRLKVKIDPNNKQADYKLKEATVEDGRTIIDLHGVTDHWIYMIYNTNEKMMHEIGFGYVKQDFKFFNELRELYCRQ